MSGLTAYRFSAQEINKMLWLKNLFTENGFIVDRFPEVYYDTFENARKVFPYLEETQEDIMNPDLLGVYVYGLDGSGKTATSKEGVVILFSDRIGNYSRLSGNVQEDIQFVVLMHELGHWFSHWPCADNLRWDYGFHFTNKRTKEALANIIAHWCCLETSGHEKVMIDLTPKTMDTGGFLHMINKKLLAVDGQFVDINNPYGAYYLLVEKDYKEVLDKIKALRAAFYLDDQHMLDFLSGNVGELSEILDVNKIEDYIDEAILASPEIWARGGLNSMIDLFRENEKYRDKFKGASVLRRFGLMEADDC
jgi:hypothetical protein